MKTSTIAMLAGGAVVAGIGGYFLLRPKSASTLGYGDLPPSYVYESEADRQAREAGLLRTYVGAKAATGASSGFQSVINGAKAVANAQIGKGAESFANTYAPGTGYIAKSIATGVSKPIVDMTESAVKKIGSTVVAGLKKLKFW